MFYVFIFDFALVALLLCCVVFFIWRWLGFRQDRKQHAIIRNQLWLRSAQIQGEQSGGQTQQSRPSVQVAKQFLSKVSGGNK